MITWFISDIRVFVSVYRQLIFGFVCLFVCFSMLPKEHAIHRNMTLLYIVQRDWLMTGLFCSTFTLFSITGKAASEGVNMHTQGTTVTPQAAPCTFYCNKLQVRQAAGSVISTDSGVDNEWGSKTVHPVLLVAYMI